MECARSVRLELVYRVFARQATNVRYQMDEVRERVEASWPGASVLYEEPYALPIRPEEAEASRGLGRLVLDYGGETPSLLVHGMRIVVSGLPEDVSVEEMEAALGPVADVPWASVQFITEFLTEIVAV